VSLVIARREFIEGIRSKHTLVILGSYIALAIVYGIGAYNNYAVALQPLPGGINNITFDNSTIEPNEWLLGNIDLVFALGALFAVALSFGSVSSEKVTKSFVLLSSYPVKGISIATGKILALALIFAPIGALLPVASIALSLMAQGQMSASLFSRILVLAGLNALYLLFWLCLGVLVSSVTSKPGNSLAICAIIWLALQQSFLGQLTVTVVWALMWPGIPLSSVPQSQVFSMFTSIGNAVPPFRFVHAVYGAYNPVGLPTSNDPLTGSSYILGSSNTLSGWFSFAFPDVIALLGSILLLILATSVLLLRVRKG